MSDTPETKRALDYIYDRDGELWERNAPEKLVTLCRQLERERDEARKERNAALSDRDAWARLCGAVDCYTPSTAEPYEALKLQRDELRAEVTALKGAVALAEWAHTCVHHTDNERAAIKSPCPVCLGAEVERLKSAGEKEFASVQQLNDDVERLKAKSQSDFENREREFREMNRVLNGLRGLWKHLPNIENKYDERLAYHLDELIERLKADAELYLGWSKWKDGIWRISQVESVPCAEWIAEDLQSAMKGVE